MSRNIHTLNKENAKSFVIKLVAEKVSRLWNHIILIFMSQISYGADYVQKD
jgi:hypothetical protein